MVRKTKCGKRQLNLLVPVTISRADIQQTQTPHFQVEETKMNP
jgi:hypothetical protein